MIGEMAILKPNGRDPHEIPLSIETEASPPIDWDSVDGPPPPRSWWIQDWLGMWPTLVAGSGGAGKTTLWQTIATSLATGKQFLGPQVKPVNVLMWLCEDDRMEVLRRQQYINEHFEIGYQDLSKLHIVPRMGFDNTVMGTAHGSPKFTHKHRELKEQVNDLAIDVLVLDNIAQIFGGNENDRHHVTMFVNGVGGINTERPFTCVFLGHPGRSSDSEFSGSTAWENAVRMRWYLGPKLPDEKADKGDEDDEQTDVMFLARRKANYSNKDWRKLKRGDGGLLIPEVQEGGTTRFDQGHRNQAAERVVLSAISRLKEIGIAVTDGTTSPDYLPAQIVAKGFAENHSRKELAGAMNRLMGQGKLLRGVIGQYANRSPRYGLTLP